MASNNAIDLLKSDHAKVKSLFEKWEHADSVQRDGIAKEVFSELEIHAELEEQIFYPAVRRRADNKEVELLDEALKEHMEVKEAIGKLKGLSGDDQEEFETLFEDLMDAVSHHVEEEEGEMLPRVESKMADQLAQLAEEMQQRKVQVAGLRKSA